MLSRRSLVLAVACSGSLARCAGTPEIQGCFLIGGSAADLGEIRLIRKSDDPETNHRLGRALLRLAQAFDVNPDCGFFDDNRLGKNAFAFEVPGTEGTVAFGQQLFRETMSRNE